MKKLLILFIASVLSFSGYTQQFEKCGTWRWDVKTLTDVDGAEVLSKKPIDSSINDLNALDRPAKVQTGTGRYPVELQPVKVHGYIIEHKLIGGSKGDQDYHVVIQSDDGTSQLIAEIPSPECPEVFANETLKELFTEIRDMYDEYVGVPPSKIKALTPPVEVEVIGIPFWDMPNHGGGHSDNGIELHPIIGIRVISPPAFADAGLAEPYYKSALNSNNPVRNHSSAMNTPIDFLVIIILGGILGMAGQGIRVIVGIKKINDLPNTEAAQQDLINTRRLVFSLFIAFSIGGVAGVLAAVNSIGAVMDKSTIIAFIAAGYAGTDFIEGFMIKNKVK